MISDKYGTELKSIAKNAGFSTIGILFMNIMAFVNNIIITRTLGADLYGLFVLATSVFWFVTIFPLLGFQSALVRYLSFYMGKNDESKVKGTIIFTFKVLSVSSVVVMIVSILLSPWISEYFFNRPALSPYLRVLLLSIPFIILYSTSNFSMVGLKLVKYQVLSTNIFPPLFLLLLLVTFFISSGSITVLIWIMLVVNIMISFISFYFLYNHYFKFKKDIKPVAEPKVLVKFAAPMYLNQFLGRAILHAPVFIMGYYLTNADIGIYNVGYKIALLIGVSISAIRTIFSPTISSLFAQNNIALVSQLYKVISKWIFTVALVTFLLISLFSDTVLHFFGNEFIEGKDVLLLLMIGELISAVAGPVGSIILMSGRPKVSLFNSFVFFSLNISLSFLLIPFYGILGAAYTYMIAILIVRIIQLSELWWFEKIHPFKLGHLKPLMAGFISFLVVYYLKSAISLSGTIELFAGTLVFGVLFVATLWILKFDKEDKYIFEVVTNKFKKK